MDGIQKENQQRRLALIEVLKKARRESERALDDAYSLKPPAGFTGCSTNKDIVRAIWQSIDLLEKAQYITQESYHDYNRPNPPITIRGEEK